MKRLEINHEYEARDPVQEEREREWWLDWMSEARDNLATKSGAVIEPIPAHKDGPVKGLIPAHKDGDLNAPIKPLDKPKGKTNETKQERTGNLGEQDARRDSDGGEASQQKQ